MTRKTIHTPKAPKAIGPYSQAVAASGTVYLSGQVGLDPATGELVAGGIEAEARRVFSNLAAVAEAAGSSLAAAVRVTIYLADFGALRRGQQDHAGVLQRALPGARDHRRGCAAARRGDRGRLHPRAVTRGRRR